VASSSAAVSPRVGLMLSAEWSDASQTERSDCRSPRPDGGGPFASCVRRTDRDEIRVLGWIQRTQSPGWRQRLSAPRRRADDVRTFSGDVGADAVGGEAQSARIRSVGFAGSRCRRRSRSNACSLAPCRRSSIPVTTERRGRRRPLFPMPRQSCSRRDHGRLTRSGELLGIISETVDGRLARFWQWTSGAESHRHATFVNAVGDKIGFGSGRSLELRRLRRALAAPTTQPRGFLSNVLRLSRSDGSRALTRTSPGLPAIAARPTA
jgi:hypothetical protein